MNRDDDNFRLVIYVLCALALAYFTGMWYINSLAEVM